MKITSIEKRNNMDKDRLDRQIEFIREIDKEKSIGRQTYLADASRKEDDAEHEIGRAHV